MPVFNVITMQRFDLKNSIIANKIYYDFKPVFNLRMSVKYKEALKSDFVVAVLLNEMFYDLNSCVEEFQSLL